MTGRVASEAEIQEVERQLAASGYCCSRMAAEISLDCDKHSPRCACPDVIIDRRGDGTYGLVVHDGGSSLVQIVFCPWCGAKVPRPVDPLRAALIRISGLLSKRRWWNDNAWAAEQIANEALAASRAENGHPNTASRATEREAEHPPEGAGDP